MKIKTLAIIGTAGRGEDAKKLTINHWRRMCDAGRKIYELENCCSLVSGGAAYADHVAVEIGYYSIPTTIWLPKKESDIETAKYYHKKFSEVVGYNTWQQLTITDVAPPWEDIIEPNIQSFGGFKDRNTKVAEQADVFLAMTFGDREKVKDGGTADTVVKMQSRGIEGYHLDLNALKMYKI